MIALLKVKLASSILPIVLKHLTIVRVLSFYTKARKSL